VAGAAGGYAIAVVYGAKIAAGAAVAIESIAAFLAKHPDIKEGIKKLIDTFKMVFGLDPSSCFAAVPFAKCFSSAPQIN
jgi:hypothetical protein